jgi:hypothetical protein
MRRWRHAGRIIFTVVFTLAVMEIAIRLLGQYDADGQFSFLGRALRPYRMPASAIEQVINDYLARQSEARYLYDPDTGWSFNPGYNKDIYVVNQAGMRSRTDYTTAPAPDRLRIALFGDSFTLSDEVPVEDSWGFLLEGELRNRGIQAEVLNFGVGGYGMDQAYLKWRAVGRLYAPDIVLFGFQPENIHRNVNIFKTFYPWGQGVPFSKPRFVLEDGALELVNYPTIAPELLDDVYRDFDSSPLAAYEAFYDAGAYAPNGWYSIKVVALMANLVYRQVEPSLVPDADRGRLAAAVVRAFGAEVEAEGAAFMVIHLPHMRYLNAVDYRDILTAASEPFLLIDTAGAFAAADESYWMPGGHYSPVANRVVADKTAAALQMCLADGSCSPPRFAVEAAYLTAGSR